MNPIIEVRVMNNIINSMIIIQMFTSNQYLNQSIIQCQIDNINHILHRVNSNIINNIYNNEQIVNAYNDNKEEYSE